MGRDKLLKQDKEINNFVYMFVLKRYNKTHIFKYKWQNGHLHLCLSDLVVKMQVNDAQSSPSTRLLKNI